MYAGVALVGLKLLQDGNGDSEEHSTAFIRQLQKHIRENLGGDLSLTALSDLVNLNTSYLSRRFKEITGRKLTDYILSLRIAETCRQLQFTNNRVKDIAGCVGYESAAHLTRIFKREIKMTPQEFRSNSSKGEAIAPK